MIPTTPMKPMKTKPFAVATAGLALFLAGCAAPKHHAPAPDPKSGVVAAPAEPRQGFQPQPPFLLNAMVDLNDHIADNTSGFIAWHSRVHATAFRMLTPQFWFRPGGPAGRAAPAAYEPVPELAPRDEFASIYEADQRYVQ